MPPPILRRASENVSRMAHAMWTQVALDEPSDFIGRKTSLSSVVDLTTQMAYAYLTTEYLFQKTTFRVPNVD